jgi:hypothetical protein
MCCLNSGVQIIVDYNLKPVVAQWTLSTINANVWICYLSTMFEYATCLPRLPYIDLVYFTYWMRGRDHIPSSAVHAFAHFLVLCQAFDSACEPLSSLWCTHVYREHNEHCESHDPSPRWMTISAASIIVGSIYMRPWLACEILPIYMSSKEPMLQPGTAKERWHTRILGWCVNQGFTSGGKWIRGNQCCCCSPKINITQRRWSPSAHECERKRQQKLVQANHKSACARLLSKIQMRYYFYSEMEEDGCAPNTLSKYIHSDLVLSCNNTYQIWITSCNNTYQIRITSCNVITPTRVLISIATQRQTKNSRKHRVGWWQPAALVKAGQWQLAIMQKVLLLPRRHPRCYRHKK